MSTSDALPTEITLIALLLFKLQVYLTSLCHYYHRPITLSTFQLLHQSTLHHMVSINPCNYLSRNSFCPQDWHPTHTVQPHIASATWSSIATTSFDFHTSRVMGPTYSNIVAIINLQVQLWNSPQRNHSNLYYQLYP
jgi:hypothetical protein